MDVTKPAEMLDMLVSLKLSLQGDGGEYSGACSVLCMLLFRVCLMFQFRVVDSYLTEPKYSLSLVEVGIKMMLHVWKNKNKTKKTQLVWKFVLVLLILFSPLPPVKFGGWAYCFVFDYRCLHSLNQAKTVVVLNHPQFGKMKVVCLCTVSSTFFCRRQNFGWYTCMHSVK